MEDIEELVKTYGAPNAMSFGECIKNVSSKHNISVKKVRELIDQPHFINFVKKVMKKRSQTRKEIGKAQTYVPKVPSHHDLITSRKSLCDWKKDSMNDWEKARINFSHEFCTGAIKLPNPCNLQDILTENVNVLTYGEKSSSSQTVISLGELSSVEKKVSTDVAIKTNFSQIIAGSDDNRSEIEYLVYKYITNPLVYNRHTPHIMLLIGLLTCDNFTLPETGVTDAMKTMIAELKEMQGYLEPTKFDHNKLTMLILEKGNGTSLGNLLGREGDLGITKYEWFGILFQLLWTIQTFMDIGLLHNDLHTGNVWIDILDEPIELFYQSYGKTWRIKSKYFVKVFDFDMSVKFPTDIDKNVIYNKWLARWPDTKINPNYDLISVLHMGFDELLKKHPELNYIDRWIYDYLEDIVAIHHHDLGNRTPSPNVELPGDIIRTDPEFQRLFEVDSSEVKNFVPYRLPSNS